MIISSSNIFNYVMSFRVLNPSFRAGLRGIEEENYRLSQQNAAPKVAFAQGDTDWSVEAVVDEDELLK